MLEIGDIVKINKVYFVFVMSNVEQIQRVGCLLRPRVSYVRRVPWKYCVEGGRSYLGRGERRAPLASIFV